MWLFFIALSFMWLPVYSRPIPPKSTNLPNIIKPRWATTSCNSIGWRLLFTAADGCNTCRCAESGLRNASRCTRMNCPPLQLPRATRCVVNQMWAVRICQQSPDFGVRKNSPVRFLSWLFLLAEISSMQEMFGYVKGIGPYQAFCPRALVGNHKLALW